MIYRLEVNEIATENRLSEKNDRTTIILQFQIKASRFFLCVHEIWDSSNGKEKYRITPNGFSMYDIEDVPDSLPNCFFHIFLEKLRAVNILQQSSSNQRLRLFIHTCSTFPLSIQFAFSWGVAHSQVCMSLYDWVLSSCLKFQVSFFCFFLFLFLVEGNGFV